MGNGELLFGWKYFCVQPLLGMIDPTSIFQSELKPFETTNPARIVGRAPEWSAPNQLAEDYLA